MAIGRIFNTEIAGEAASGEEIFRVAGAAAVFETRRQGSKTAAVNTDAATLLERIAALGLNIDNASGAKTELRR